MQVRTIYADAFEAAILRGLTASVAERVAMDAAADFADRTDRDPSFLMGALVAQSDNMTGE